MNVRMCGMVGQGVRVGCMDHRAPHPGTVERIAAQIPIGRTVVRREMMGDATIHTRTLCTT